MRPAFFATWAFLIFIIMGVTATRTADGAFVNWGAPATISGDTDVVTTGTLVYAYNMGDAGVTATTVNGVNFAPFALAGNPTTVGNVSLQETNPSSTLIASNIAFGSTRAPFSNLSQSYQALLRSAITEQTGETIVLTMGGLTVGQSYTFQIWDNTSIAGQGSETVQSSSGGGIITLSANTTGVPGGVGQYGVGTFIADATSESVLINGTGSAQINGFQLRAAAVPEPSSLLLCGVAGMLGLGWSKVRRARTA